MKEVSYFTSNVIKITLKADLGECWIWKLALDGSGRPLYTDRSQKPSTRSAYRDLWRLVKNPELDSETNLNHHCDEPRCINPDHLYEGTDIENRKDAVERKRIPLRKLKGKEEEIVKLFKEGIEQQEIAKRLGVHKQTILRFLNGQTIQGGHNYVQEAQKERDEKIKSLFAQGLGLCQIILQANVPASVVWSVVPEIKNKPKSSTTEHSKEILTTMTIEERNAKIREERASGVSVKELAIKYGVSSPLIYTICSKK